MVASHKAAQSRIQAADDSAVHAAGMGRMGGRPGGIGGMYVGPDDPIFSGRFPGGGMGGEPPLHLQHSVRPSAHHLWRRPLTCCKYKVLA